MKRLRAWAQAFALCVVVGATCAIVATFLSEAIRHPPTIRQVRELAEDIRDVFAMCGEERK